MATMQAEQRRDQKFEGTYCGRLVAGRYRVLRRLGQGGIGRVYRAEQASLDREVALKVIRPDRRADPIISARFLREARAAGRIRSPHVVTLFDCGSDDEGELYIAMELLKGESLAERLKHGPPISAREGLRIAVGVAKGLAAAHEAGVLHRDLKPGNVFLCDDGTVKVLDFGIAKLLDEDQGKDGLTGLHRIVGTPIYMSPEAALRRPLTAASDLYSLGVLMYEMFTGKPPFKTGSPLETLRAHLRCPVPKLTDTSPWLQVPKSLEDLIDRLLAKEASDRPDTAEELVDLLESIVQKLNSHDDLDSEMTAIAVSIDIDLDAMRRAFDLGQFDEQSMAGASPGRTFRPALEDPSIEVSYPSARGGDTEPSAPMDFDDEPTHARAGDASSGVRRTLPMPPSTSETPGPTLSLALSSFGVRHAAMATGLVGAIILVGFWLLRSSF